MAMKTTNEYAKGYPKYRDTPKAVIAAVAYSLALRICADCQEDARRLLGEEWDALSDCGIIPQTRPTKNKEI